MIPDRYSDPISMKLLTVNIHKGFTLFNRRFMLQELRKALLQAAPDLVFLQEVTGAHEGHARKLADWPTQSHYEYLADTVWPEYAYGRNAVYPEGHHGNALLSRYPITASINHDISIAGPEPRGLLYCVVQPPTLRFPVHAICVHLGLNQRHRHIQLHSLCSLIDARVPAEEPLIVAGDFNDWRQRADSVLTQCGMQEVHTLHAGKPLRTYPSLCPLLRLDRIYVRGVDEAQPGPRAPRIWSRLSDHVPLLATIRF